MAFVPCKGKTACRDDGERCLTCGRSLEEIAQLRELLDRLASMAIENRYRNVDEFATYIADKLPKIVIHRMQQDQTTKGLAHADR